jgi:hypothetical protein
MGTIMFHRITYKLKLMAQGKNVTDDLDDDEIEENKADEEDSEMGAFGKDFVMEFLEDQEEVKKIIHSEGDDES